MTTISVIFFLAFSLSLIITPLVRVFAERLRVLDHPGERKEHTTATPRLGGLAIVSSFLLAFVPCIFYPTEIMNSGVYEGRLISLAIGGVIIFLLGIYDDIKGVDPLIKIVFQMVAAVVVYSGGIRIEQVGIPHFGIVEFGWFSLPVTVFWILLVINAINLIDGLDGLAAGVSFFVCLVLMALCIIGQRYFLAMILAALSGTLIGFLRYNFNPASIFMGDSGSYFLGYMIATLSILGVIKSQAAATLLIPVIALWFPLMDTAWSTLRRFATGRNIFQADQDHFHHKLVKLGFSQKKAVIVLYGLTVFLGATALYVVNQYNERAGILLVFAGVLCIGGIKKLGYFNTVGFNKVLRWTSDVSDEMGLSRDRRLFFGDQLEIHLAMDVQTFRDALTGTVDRIGLDFLEIRAGNSMRDGLNPLILNWCREGVNIKSESERQDNEKQFYIKFPIEHDGFHMGVVVFGKERFCSGAESTQVLRRIMHLRRTMAAKLYEFYKTGKVLPESRKIYTLEKPAKVPGKATGQREDHPSGYGESEFLNNK